MRKIMIFSVLGLTLGLAGAAMAHSDRGERRHHGERGEHSRSHDERSEHGTRTERKRHHDERGEHGSRRDHDEDDDRGSRSKDRSGKRS